MADFNDVFHLDIDTTKAEQKIKRLEARVAKFEAKLVKSFKSAKLQKAVTSLNTKLKRTDAHLGRITKGLGGFDAATARATAAAENRFDRINRAIRRVGTAPNQASKRVDRFLKGVYQGSNKAGIGLDRMGRKGKIAGDEVARGAKKARVNLLRIAPAARTAGTSLTSMALRASALIGVAAGVRDITGEYLAFDRQMTIAAAKFSKLEPAMAPGTEAFKRYRNEIRGAAVDTEHTAAGVASAVDFWAKAGKTAEQTKAVIPITLDFASANTDASGAALEVARAGDILSDVLGQFKLAADDPTQLMTNTARVADVMSAAANTANVSADEMFEAFKTGGPVMTAVGGDIEQAATMVAAMANAGIKGSIAGRQLKIMMASLNAPTSKQAKLLEKYNVSVKDSEGNTRKLADVVGDLDAATKGLGTGDRFEVFGTLLGRQGITGFLNLLAEGKANLKSSTAELRKAGGETQRLADITRKSASVQIQQFWNKITDLGFKVIEQSQLFEKLGDAMESVDWDEAAKFIGDDFVPAMVTAGGVIKNTLWPAVKETASILNNVFGPAIKLVSTLTGGMSTEGNTLAKTLGRLGAMWIAYRGYLAAVKALGMVSHMVDFTRQITRAGTAQGVLNTKTAATNLTMANSVRQLGLIRSGALLAGSAFAGWTIGSIIHDQLVEPLAKGLHQLQLLKAEIEDTKSRDLTKRNSAMLEDDAETADEALKIEKEHQRVLEVTNVITGMGGMGAMGVGAGFAPQPKKEVEKLETFKTTVEEQLYVRRQEENIQRYETAPQEIAPQTTPFEPVPGVEQSVDFGLAEEISAINEILDKMQTEVLSPEIESQMAAMPVLGEVSLSDFVGTQEAQLKLSEEQAIADRDFQSKMLAKQVQSDTAPREVKIEIGDTNINIETKGGDPQEFKRVLITELDRRERIQNASLKDAVRSEGATEF